MKWSWECETCGCHGSVDNPGLPVTSLANLAAFDHLKQRRNCPTAASSEVILKPGGCVFQPSGDRQESLDVKNHPTGRQTEKEDPQ